MMFRSLYFLFSLTALFAIPSNGLVSLLAYVVGYPALILLAYTFPEKIVRAQILYVFGVLFFLIHMRWMGFAVYHGSMIFYAYMLLSLFFAWNYFALGYFLPTKIGELNFARVLGVSLLFCIGEYSRLWILCGFPFHQVGLILLFHSYFAQLCAIVGSYGLTFIVVSSALLIARFFIENRYQMIGCVLTIPLALGAGIFHSSSFFRDKAKDIKVGIVQTGWKVEQKWSLDGRENEAVFIADQWKRIWDNIVRLKDADLIVLPEVTLPGDVTLKRFFYNDLESIFPKKISSQFSRKKTWSVLEVFQEISAELKNDIIFGGVNRRSNSAFYLSKGRLLGKYDKRRLVPFGEYLPFAFLEKISKKYGADANFISGKGDGIFIGDWKILPSICFDEGYPSDFLNKMSHGPDFHVNISNDAWFVFSNLGEAHFYTGLLRSLEYGMFSIRACNTGISCIISPEGMVLQRMAETNVYGQLNNGFLFESISLYKKGTFFSKMGNLGWLLFLSIILILNWLFAKKTHAVKA